MVVIFAMLVDLSRRVLVIFVRPFSRQKEAKLSNRLEDGVGAQCLKLPLYRTKEHSRNKLVTAI